MLRIAIAEDDEGYQKVLQDYCSRFSIEKGEPLEVSMFSDGIALAERYHPIYDLILLDIEMPLLDGMATAQRIRLTDSEVLIMFITNMKQYAIEGYKVGAMDYVLKPISYFAFASKLEKARSILDRRKSNYLLLRNNGEMIRVPADSVYYIEVFNHRLHFHTEQGDYVTSSSLHTLEQQLSGAHFSRCNKSYLVNLRHISRIRKDTVLLTDGTELPISRLRKKDFLLAVSDYYGGGGT